MLQKVGHRLGHVPFHLQSLAPFPPLVQTILEVITFLVVLPPQSLSGLVYPQMYTLLPSLASMARPPLTTRSQVCFRLRYSKFISEFLINIIIGFGCDPINVMPVNPTYHLQPWSMYPMPQYQPQQATLGHNSHIPQIGRCTF